MGSFREPSLLFFEGSVSLELDVRVEFGGAIGAFWDEMEADTTNVLVGTEVLEVVDLLTFDLEFQQTKVLQADLVAHLQVTHHCFCDSHHQAFEHTTTDAHASGGSLLKQLATLDGLVVNGYGLVFAIGGKRWLGFFLNPVSHKLDNFDANIHNFRENSRKTVKNTTKIKIMRTGKKKEEENNKENRKYYCHPT